MPHSKPLKKRDAPAPGPYSVVSLSGLRCGAGAFSHPFAPPDMGPYHVLEGDGLLAAGAVVTHVARAAELVGDQHHVIRLRFLYRHRIVMPDARCQASKRVSSMRRPVMPRF